MDLGLRADAVLFDKDGTLFDFGDTWAAWAEAILAQLSQGDPDLARRIAAAVGYDIETRTFLPNSIAIAGTPDQVAAHIAPHVDRPMDVLMNDINTGAALAPMSPVVPLRPLFEHLQTAGLALGVATNDALVPTMAHLKQAMIADLFSYIVASDMGITPKPHPAMCTGFSDKTGLDPARIVMVGDSLHDLHAGRAAGMQTVGVRTGIATAATLAPHADIVLDHIGHLPAWLGLPAQ